MSAGPEFGAAQSGLPRYEVLKRIVGCAYMYRVMESDEPVFLRILEIGSYEGGSALEWSAAIVRESINDKRDRSGFGVVICVDPWEPYLNSDESPHIRQMNEDLRSGLVYHRFKRNAECADPRAPIFHIRGTFKKAIPALPRMPPLFDIVYVDGAHTYLEVMEDLELSHRFLRLGGILCGDDLERQVGNIPHEKLHSYLNSTREFDFGFHPGVTRAVGEFFKGDVSCHEGVWAMRRTVTGWETVTGLRP